MRESCGWAPKTLMQIDNVHLSCWSIKRAHVKHEKKMCVKCKQIKADLELRHLKRLHFFLSYDNNKQLELGKLQGVYTPELIFPTHN